MVTKEVTGKDEVPMKLRPAAWKRIVWVPYIGMILPLAAMSLIFDDRNQERVLSSAVAGNREWKAPVSTRNLWPDKESVIKKPEAEWSSTLTFPCLRF